MRPIVWLLGGISAFGGILTLADLATGNHGSGRGLAYGLIMLLGGGSGFVFLLLWLRNSRLLAGGGVVGYQDALGRRHTWMASEIGAVVKAEIVYSGSSTSRPAIYVLGTDGRRLMAFPVLAWSPAALEKLVRESGRQLQVLEKPISAAAFRRLYPHSLIWAAAHPWLMASLLIIGVIALVIAGVVILVR